MAYLTLTAEKQAQLTANPKPRPLIEFKLNPHALIEYPTCFDSSSIAFNLLSGSLSHHTHLMFLT